MSKHLLNLRGLFSNTKFLVVFSIVLAFIFWVVVAIEYTPIVQSVIEDVPIVIDMTDTPPERLGLKPFGGENLTVNITVEGKRYDVGGKKVTAEDFIVEAETAYVDSAGEKALAIKATPVKSNVEYEIVDLSSDYVNVFFDREVTKEISLTPKITSDSGNVAAEGFVFYEEEVSVEKTISVTGPKTEIDKIQEAFLEINLAEPLTMSKAVEGAIVFETGTVDEVKYLSVNGEKAENIKLTATIPIYKLQKLPVTVSFTHAPKAYLDTPLKFDSIPETVYAAVLQEGTEEISELVIGEIDFSTITPVKHVFSFDSSDIKNVKILDNTKKIDVTLQLPEGIATAKVNALKDNIVVEGADADSAYDIQFEGSGIVNVCAGSAEIQDIKPEDIHGVINLTDIEVNSAEQRVPIRFTVMSSENSWVSGTYYATVKIK